MPKLPDATNLSGVNIGAPRSMVDIGVPDYIAASNVVARGVQDVGNAAVTIIDERRKKFAAQERFDTKIGLLKAEEAYAERVRGLDPLDPEYVEKKKAARRETFAPVLSSVKDPENRQRFEEETLVDYTNIGIKAGDEQRSAFGKKAEIDVDTLTEEQRKRIRKGENPQDVIAETVSTIDDNQYLDTLTKEEKKRKAQKALAYDAVETNSLKRYGKVSGGALVRAVIGAESGNDPNAVSPKGAQGLMQVMPETAAEIAAELGDDAFFRLSNSGKLRYLRDENVSIRYGTYYLNKMLRRYDGDVEAALIAYNAGPGNADKWVKAGRDYAALPKPEETQPYVQKIFKTLGVDGATVSSDPRYFATRDDILADVEQDPMYRLLDVDEADRLKSNISTTIKKSEDEAKVKTEALKTTIKTAIASDIATIENGGVASPDLTFDQISSVLGKEKAEEWRLGTADAAERARVTADFMSMPNAEIEATVNEYEAAIEATKGTPDYSRKLENLKKIKAKQNSIVAERKQNPSQAAFRYSSVQNAYKQYLEIRSAAATNPNQDRNKIVTDAFGQYLQASTEAQVGFGIAREGVAIVPDDVAQNVAGLFLDLPVNVTGRESNVTARDTLTRVYEQLRGTFGDYTDEVIAYSLAKSKPLSRETTQVMVGLLGSLAKGKDIRRSAADTAQRLQEADEADPGLMGFFDWFNSDQPQEEVPLGNTTDETLPIEDTAGAR